MSAALPIVDVGALAARGDGRDDAVRAIEEACRAHGFFYARNHGVPDSLLADLADAAWRFFRLPEETKAAIAMARAGKAWRGWFPLGGELTSGRPDRKEGLYFGAELGEDDPRVRAGLPLHGRNLFPEDPPELGPLVLRYMRACEAAAQTILEGVALSLGLDARYFFERYTRDPTILFRIFHYPSAPPDADDWGVGEHTDYGLLTLLAQDDVGGLEVKTSAGWIAAPPIPGTLVCNIGDMLDRLTGGWCRSTPHRVRNTSGRGRLSFPFFFDPAFDAVVTPLPRPAQAQVARWDGADLTGIEGPYGEYLLAKVGKVFPDLKQQALG